MPLNYSKWDTLEISDDSDIEGHPNVDHKSLVRWKQRDIHEKREMRKMRMAQLDAEISCNDVLLPRLRAVADKIAKDGPPYFSSLVDRLRTSPSPEKPATSAPEQKTYDEMILALLNRVQDEVVNKGGIRGDDPRLGDALAQELNKHVEQLGEHTEQFKKELHDLEAETKKKITSEDIHDGFDSHYVPPPSAPAPIKNALAESSKKVTATEFEVLNPKGVAAATDTFASSSSSAVQSSGDTEDELPELTPALEGFSHLPLRGYEQSWEYIKAHRDVIVPGASDALLVAAFKAESEGRTRYAQQCVNQSLLLQYCDKLGRDGVRVFFQKMVSNDPRATSVFEKDVADTYAHLKERVRISKAEEAASVGQEQIQLVPEDPSQTISFNVPDGPPPEHLQLEGPGTEDLDIEQVRKALQLRWDVFVGFPPDLQEALKSGSLDKVNLVLGKIKVDKAEEIVQLLDVAGILNFSEEKIRDETGRNKVEAEDEEDADADTEDVD